MNNKKLWPEIKIISLQPERKFQTPTCSCDFFKKCCLWEHDKECCLWEHDKYRSSNRNRCICDDKFEDCLFDLSCSYVKRKKSDLLVLEPPPCDKCLSYDENTGGCCANIRLPLDDYLPEGCECHSMLSDDTIVKHVTRVTGNDKKTYKEYSDPKTGKTWYEED